MSFGPYRPALFMNVLYILFILFCIHFDLLLLTIGFTLLFASTSCSRSFTTCTTRMLNLYT